MSDFKPQSEKEILSEMLAPDGTYDFEVIASENKISKAKNKMAKVKIKYWVGEKERIITDYLLPAFKRKFRHFYDTCGKLDIYETGVLDASLFVGWIGKVKIGSESSEDNPDNVRNTVVDYVKKGFIPIAGKTIDQFGDEIPY